jgi:hypothetical protein
MPWSTGDVGGKTKKATSPTAKRQWVHVANSALARGESEKTAIMEANGVAKRRRSHAEILYGKGK